VVPRRPDPVRLEVFHHLMAALCEEAGALLQRAAVSPNIRERRDFSVALFDREARLTAQAAHIPVHLGSAADSVAAARAAIDFAPGDVALLNDPYAGGTHLPDLTMVRPVFLRGSRAPDWFLCNRAHHADVGGATPGSMGIAGDLLAEGLVLPPVLLHHRGRPQQDLVRLFCANVRGSDERLLDLQAQAASLERAEQRLRALCDSWGAGVVAEHAGFLMDYSERLGRAELRRLRRGRFHAEDRMEDDGLGNGPFRLRLELEVGPRGLVFDWRRSDAQAKGGINANRSVVLAASVYALRCLCPGRLPTNDGLFRLLRLQTRPGTIVDPIRPAPVVGGNVETSQRLVDVALQALGRALPGQMPASSAGTLS
jgi:N-methylhydantoinase B